jgi:hypothetical protein
MQRVCLWSSTWSSRSTLLGACSCGARIIIEATSSVCCLALQWARQFSQHKSIRQTSTLSRMAAAALSASSPARHADGGKSGKHAGSSPTASSFLPAKMLEGVSGEVLSLGRQMVLSHAQHLPQNTSYRCTASWGGRACTGSHAHRGRGGRTKLALIRAAQSQTHVRGRARSWQQDLESMPSSPIAHPGSGAS